MTEAYDLIFVQVDAPTSVAATKDDWSAVPMEDCSTSELPQFTMVTNTLRFKDGWYGDERPIGVAEFYQGVDPTRVYSIDSSAVNDWLRNSGGGVNGRPPLNDWVKVYPESVRLSVGLVKRPLVERSSPGRRQISGQEYVSNILVSVIDSPRIDPPRRMTVGLSFHDYQTTEGQGVAVMPCVCGRYVPAFGVDRNERLLVRDTGSFLWGCVRTVRSASHDGQQVVCVERVVLASTNTGVHWAHDKPWLRKNDWLFNISRCRNVVGGRVKVSPTFGDDGSNTVGLVCITAIDGATEETTQNIVASEPTLRANIAATGLTPEPLKYRDVTALSTMLVRWVSLVVDAMSWVYVVVLCMIIPTLDERGALLLSGEVVAEVLARVIMPMCLLYDGYNLLIALEGFLAPIAASMRYFCGSGALVRALWTSPIFLEVVAGALPLVSVVLGDSSGDWFVFRDVIGTCGGVFCLFARSLSKEPVYKAWGLTGYVFLYLWNLVLQTQVLYESGEVTTAYMAIILNLPELLIVLGVVSVVIKNGSDTLTLRQMIVDRTLKGLLTHIGVASSKFESEWVLVVKIETFRGQDTARLEWGCLSDLIRADFRGFSLRGIQSLGENQAWVAHTTVAEVGGGYSVLGLGSSETYGGLAGRAESTSSLMKGCTSEVVSNYYTGDSWGGMVTASSAKIILPLIGNRGSALETV